MTITIDLSESVEARIRQVAMHRKTDTEAIFREMVMERFPPDENSEDSGLHHLEEALAELDAMPAIPSQVDYSRINTASCYAEE